MQPWTNYNYNLFNADETKTQSKTKNAISTIGEAAETEGLSSSVLNSLIQFIVGGTGDGSKYMYHSLWVGGSSMRQGGCTHSIEVVHMTLAVKFLVCKIRI